MSGLVVKPRARLFHGHDWVYATEVLKVFGDPQPGDVVSLKDGKDRPLGSAIYNPRSQIIARRFSRRRQDLDHDFFCRRVGQAVAYRQRQGVDLNRCRVVWSESDGLPGVIVDRYGDLLVLQTLTQAMDQRKEILVGALVETLSPRTVIERNDAPVRQAEGLELVTGTLHGPSPEGPVEIELGGLRLAVDPQHGQKTGFYLDQADNYLTVAGYARGRRVLDCFANQGAFALCCAQAGAASVRAVEVSGDAIAGGRQNEARNQERLAVPVAWEEANVFDLLPALEKRGEQFDLVVLDPPSFTKSKGRLQDALRGYKEIHLRALKLLSPEGLLATFSCSHHVSEAVFSEVVTDAMVDAHRHARLLRRLGQSLDHPVVPTLPETEYLRGYLLEAMPGR